MAKDFAAIYSSVNDSAAINQKIFIKEESTRGAIVTPAGTDHILQLTGGNVGFETPIESSPIRSGRHHRGIIKKKDITTWSFPFYFMIDTTLGAASDAEIDLAARVLWKSLLGRERVTAAVGNLTYDAVTAPSTTFTLIENGDQWANQAPGAFVNNGNLNLPGDGEATWAVSGEAKTMYKIGVAQSNVDNDGGNTITVGTGEGERFEIGGIVMLVETDGTTRSADTAGDTSRKITGISGDVITVDGAALADADFSGSAGYLTYYEPETPTAINAPQTGLEGSITIAGLTTDCIRSLSLAINNDHEIQNFCYGTKSLSGPLFSPTSRVSMTLAMELNLNHNLVEFIKGLKAFTGENITTILGDVTSRHMEMTMPKWIPGIPVIPIPDSGTIPTPFSGLLYEATAEAGDELTLEYK